MLIWRHLTVHSHIRPRGQSAAAALVYRRCVAPLRGGGDARPGQTLAHQARQQTEAPWRSGT